MNKYGFPAVQKAKGIFKQATAGDIVRVILEEDRKNVSKGKYVTRVKTPTKKGVEVVIKGFRVRISSMKNVNFIQRSDGYAYLF